MGVENGMFRFEIGSGFEDPGGTPPPRIPRSTPPGGLHWAQKRKPCFVTLRNFFRSTAGQGFQNTKWPAVLYFQ